jgi:glycosyltransferase involved in cell wall biosynthesis
MKLKNIIIFFPSMERGGVGINLYNLVNYFNYKKINTHLISNKNFIKKEIKNDYFFLNKYKDFVTKFIPQRYTRALFAAKILYQILKKSNKEDTVVFSLQSSMIAILVCKFLGFKIISRNSEDPISSTIYSDNKFLSIFIFLLRFLFYNFSDGVLTNSKGSKKSLELFMINKNKVKHIYNPYLSEIKKINKKNKKDNLFLSIGRLTKQKNFRILIYTFSKFIKSYPSYKLIIVGDGDQKSELVNLISKLNLNKNVKIIAWVKDTEKFFIKSKVFILTSLYEGLGNVLIDSINNEVPCISTDCKSGPSEILLNGKGGYLVPINDSEVLLKKMFFSVENYHISIKQTVYAKKFLNRFSQKKCCPDYLNYLSSFL